ncbi:MAG TPA: Calx-beta domain-containing protein [Pyrinomonadaceae bacterium]|nr:Calx-beta domain-containing protein [Pyrinomonadaceae bacterium]
MRSRNTKPADASHRAIKRASIRAIKWSASVLPAFVLALGLTALEPRRVAQAAGPSVVQFSAGTYAVNEGVTFRAITVTRTGDVSGPATVDYTTANLSASQRTDYTAAPGTLRFGANESSKSFDVLISQDIKLEGTETFTITLSNGTGQALLGSPSTATVTITDDAIEAGPNPIDFNDIFVGQHYHDFLARQSDNPGQVFWENQISICGNNPTCIDDRRTNVSAAFFLSIEFQQTGYFVIRIHKGAFGSAKSNPRYLPFLRDQRRVGEGVIVGNTGWDTLLEVNRQAYLQEFVSRPEFVAVFPQGTNAFTYVDTLFANEGVVPTASERQAAVNAYGTGNTLGRAAALRSVVESDSVFDKQYNPAFVLMQYFGYLRRDPDDAPDNNFNGYDFWLNKMNQVTVPGENMRNDDVALNRVKRADMVKSFIVSGEYRGRFGL